MNTATRQLLVLLADGEIHSGESLGEAVAATRAAVRRQLAGLGQLGIEIEAVRGRGYRLGTPLDLLDIDAVRAAYGDGNLAIDLVDVTGSTSTDLVNALTGDAEPVACARIAEFQHSGQGRRGRAWLCPYGCGITLSLRYRFECAPARLAGFSLHVGMATAELLTQVGVRGAAVKWPNDLVVVQAPGHFTKLGGILIDVRAEAKGPSTLVIGVGLNYRLPEHTRRDIDQPSSDLCQFREAAPGDRSRVAGRLIRVLERECGSYLSTSTAELPRRWSAYDALHGRNVLIESGERREIGVADGVETDGGLRVQTPGGLRIYYSGDVTVRQASV